MASDVLWLTQHRFNETKAAIRDGALEAYKLVLESRKKR